MSSFDMQLCEDIDYSIKFKKNYRVILFNDPTTTEDFILDEVLCNIFKYSVKEGYALMKSIEADGCKCIAVLPKKLAEVRVKKSKSLAEQHNFNDFKIKIEED